MLKNSNGGRQPAALTSSFNYIVFSVLCFLTLPALAQKAGPTLSFLVLGEAKYIQCPTITPAMDGTAHQVLGLTGAALSHLLEGGGFRETVTIRFQASDEPLNFVLGTFTPQWTDENRGSQPVWPLNAVIKILVSPQNLKNIIIKRVRQRIPLNRKRSGSLLIADQSGSLLNKIAVYYELPFQYLKREYRKLDHLLIMHRREQAIAYCQKLRGRVQKECHKILAQALFREKLDRMIARQSTNDVLKFCQNRKENLRCHCYLIAGDILYRKAKYHEAAMMFKAAATPLGLTRAGEAYFQLGDLDRAAACHALGLVSAEAGHAYAALADKFKKKGDMESAKKYYTKAVDQFEIMIKDYAYRWNKRDNSERLRCRHELTGFHKTVEESRQAERLQMVLDEAGRYCLRLKQALIRFFCREEIVEKTRRQTTHLEYDYQLIKEGEKISEQRTLIRINTILVKKKNVPLATRKYVYENLIFGPISFLDPSWQSFFTFRLTGESNTLGRPTVSVEVLPRQLSLARKFMGHSNILAGKIWIDARDFSVLKIQWHPKFIITNFHKTLDKARQNSVDPEIHFVTEFGQLEGGLRFPSRYHISEYHVNDAGEKSLQARLNVVYKDFRFFRVGTQTVREEMVENRR